jgi:DNA-binding MarR family transcriptional regulator
MDTIDDRDLILLLEVEKHSSYREMAEAIHKSLRTVQMRLTSLEWRGMINKSPLRKNRSVTLTPAGLEVLKHAFPKSHPVR